MIYAYDMMEKYNTDKFNTHNKTWGPLKMSGVAPVVSEYTTECNECEFAEWIKHNITTEELNKT
jgi:hypothetical protein